jgi:hypothetical protein
MFEVERRRSLRFNMSLPISAFDDTETLSRLEEANRKVLAGEPLNDADEDAVLQWLRN